MDAINGFGAATSLPTKVEDKSVLSQDEFFEIMITELTNQDPLEPLDNSEFLNQVTQMQTLETMNKLTEGIEALLLGQQLSSAGSLIGKNVTGLTAEGFRVSGEVNRLIVEGDRVMLGLDNEATLPLNQVLEVTGDSGDE